LFFWLLYIKPLDSSPPTGAEKEGLNKQKEDYLKKESWQNQLKHKTAQKLQLKKEL